MIKKKILIVISSLKLGGGAERVASILGREIYKRNYEVNYLTFYDEKCKYVFSGKEYCLNEKESKSIIIKFLKLFSRSYKIAKFCKQNNMDVVISFMEEANFSSILSKLFLNRSKIISSIRNNILKKGLIDRVLIRALYPLSDYIITVSRFIESVVKKEYNIESISTIYNPLRKLTINEKFILEYNNKFLFISIGRLSRVKNYYSLIKAFKIVYNLNNDSKLLILGEGKLRTNLEKFTRKLNLEDKVILLGNKNNVADYLNHADCYILPSYYEGMPNALLEACNFDLPIIATDCLTGPREILCPDLSVNEKIDYPYFSKYGIVTKPFEIEKENLEETNMLSNLMIEVMTNKDNYKVDRSENMKRFDLDNVINQWVEVVNGSYY